MVLDIFLSHMYSLMSSFACLEGAGVLYYPALKYTYAVLTYCANNEWK